MISGSDVGKSIAHVIVGGPEKYGNRNLTVTGPSQIGLEDVVNCLQKVNPKMRIRAEDISDETYVNILTSIGYPHPAIGTILDSYKSFIQTNVMIVTNTFQEITGTTPKTLDDFFLEIAQQ